MYKFNSDTSFYYLWKVHRSHYTGLTLIDSDYLPFHFKNIKHDEEVETLDEYFGTRGVYLGDNLSDGYGQSYIFLKISKDKQLEEIRCCSAFYGGYLGIKEETHDNLEDIIKIQKQGKIYDSNFSLEKSFFDKGFTILKTESQYPIEIKSGNFTLLNYYDEYFYNSGIKPPEEIGTKASQSLIKNTKEISQIAKARFVLRFEIIDRERHNDNEDFGFSFHWKKGMYQISYLEISKEKEIIKDDKFIIHFPCCSKKVKYHRSYLTMRWGVQYLHCKECDKYESNLEKYLIQSDGSPIDSKFYESLRKHFHIRMTTPYAVVIRPMENAEEKIDFMVNN